MLRIVVDQIVSGRRVSLVSPGTFTLVHPVPTVVESTLRRLVLFKGVRGRRGEEVSRLFLLTRGNLPEGVSYVLPRLRSDKTLDGTRTARLRPGEGSKGCLGDQRQDIV